MELPPFPVTDDALDLLSAAINPDWTTAERTSLNDVCDMYTRLGGSDPDAVESWEPIGAGVDDLDPAYDRELVPVYRDPQYAPSDVIAALIDEIRRLRGGLYVAIAGDELT